MGLFGRKKAEGTSVVQAVPPRAGWMVECAPQCGFLMKNHNQQEAAKMLQLHMKNSHKTNVTDAEAMGGVKAVTY